MGGAGAQLSYPARPPRRWPWVLLAIWVVVALAFGGLVVYGVYTVVRQVGRATCLPGDFPTYQGARTTGLHVYSGTGGSSCDMVFDSDDSASTVTAFFTESLDQGGWQVVGTSPSDGTLAFQRRNDPNVHGQLRVLGRGDHSTFEVLLQTG